MYYIGNIPCVPYDELIHDGTKGMKWGVRRFRNYDGTLTDAGKARYAVSTGKKNALDMTDKELESAVRRLRNEKEWKHLVKELDAKPVSEGRKALGGIFKTIGMKLVLPTAAGFTTSMASGLGKALSEEIGEGMREDRKAPKEDKGGQKKGRSNAKDHSDMFEEPEYEEPQERVREHPKRNGSKVASRRAMSARAAASARRGR